MAARKIGLTHSPYPVNQPASAVAGLAGIVQSITHDVSQGTAVVVQGGRRCGKTTLLRQLAQTDFGNNVHSFVPLYLDVRRETNGDPHAFYSAILGALGHPTPPSPDFQHAEQALVRIAEDLDNRLPHPVRLLFLLDNFDCFDGDTVYHHINYLLRASSHSHRFNCVVSTRRRVGELVKTGSHLSDWSHHYLRGLTFEHCVELIAAGFENVPLDTCFQLFETVGGHPYVLSAVLDRLWRHGDCSAPAISAALAGLSNELAPVFQLWSKDLTASDRAVLHQLTQVAPEAATLPDLQRSLRHIAEPIEIADAVQRLSSQALVRFDQPSRLCWNGELFARWHRENPASISEPDAASAGRFRRVFVVHGRDHARRELVQRDLREMHLEPLVWEDCIRLTGSPHPTILDVLRAGFANSQAVIVLMTPDDIARVKDEFIKSEDFEYEREPTGQPRQNVLIEAGMALGLFFNRTVLLQFGQLRPPSDIAGLTLIFYDGTPQTKDRLRVALQHCGCRFPA